MANAIFNADQAEDLVGAYNEFRVVDGFLRRILKLMFFGIKPVFVFDGQTPALKKKTLQERRKVRRNFGREDPVDMHKAAEKLLNRVVTEKVKAAKLASNTAQNDAKNDSDQ